MKRVYFPFEEVADGLTGNIIVIPQNTSYKVMYDIDSNNEDWDPFYNILDVKTFLIERGVLEAIIYIAA
jgi:hypothetical protein